MYEPSPSDVPAYGTVTAIDMNTGKIAYQNKTEQPMRGGFTSTASGIAFYGELNGKMHAIETKTGKMLWEFQTSGESVNSAPSIFVQDGKQYIAQTTGGQNPKLIVFGLDGDKTQGQSQSGDNNTSHKK